MIGQTPARHGGGTSVVIFFLSTRAIRWTLGVIQHLEQRMAVFYSFLHDESGQVPDQDPLVFRVASFVGATSGADLVPGPLLDTDEIDDVRELLMLCGLGYEDMKPVQLNGGRAGRLGWISLDAVLAITPEIVFALSEAAARDFLLDLKTASDMLKAIIPRENGGCLIEVIAPASA
jgi:hypothetical protein